MTLLRICSVAGVTAFAAAGALVCFGGNKKTPEQREMLRRQRILALGRITDGTVLEVREHGSDAHAPAAVQLVLFYSYQVAGVHYEAAQDVTPLRGLFNLDTRSIGIAASVRYDPRHPLNSIVVAETWCGLRT